MASQHIRSEFLSLQKDVHVHCLVLLNHALPKATVKLWKQASFKICADGGTNRLYDALPSMLGISEEEADEARREFAPNIICGDLDSMRQVDLGSMRQVDLDSMRQDVRHFYEKICQVPVLDMSHDQDSTDLAKCLSYVEQNLGATDGTADSSSSSLHKDDIIVLGAMGGRLDHTLSNLNALYQFRHLNITLWGEGNLVRLVRRGRCMIHPLRSIEGPSCGLVPLTGPTTASSTGLKWNLDETRLEVGGLISTCNVMEADHITVQSDKDLLWMSTVSEDI